MDELVIDSFAGGGGASLGIAWAIGRPPDIAINHDRSAIAMHEKNHPSTRHLLEDVVKADMRSIVGRRAVGLLWASPDCFAAGTLVLAKRGLVPIEQIVVGDEVLTHRNRWQRVTALVQKESETIKLKGHGHYGLDVTPDHQIYSQTFAWREREVKGELVKSQQANSPLWIEAHKMLGKVRHRWATPHSVPACDVVPPPAEMDTNLFYFLGRWAACGSFSKDDVVISCGYHDAEWTRQYLTDNPVKDKSGTSFNLRYRELPDTTQLIVGCSELRRWIESNFGKLSPNKRVPTWLLGVQASWREAFLKGYIDGDGSVSENVVSASSTSKSLALGVKLLATSLGKTVAFHHSWQDDKQIDGRTLKGGDCYKVVWRNESERVHSLDDVRHRFTRVKKILPGSKQIVYCIEVEKDHSFVADGIVVHNCKHFSRAKGAKPVEKAIRSLAWVVVKWAKEIRPRVILLENVREFADWGPLVPRMECRSCEWRGTEGQAVLARIHRKCPRCNAPRLRQLNEMVPDPDKKGVTFKQWVGRLKALGYKVEWRNLNAADYGAPTHRRRLFLVARRDGEPIDWPEPTHSDPKKTEAMPLFGSLKPWRTAAECIDWSIPCPSIFEREKPLVEATLRRIAMGIKRYVLEAEKPFIVRCNHGGEHFRGQPTDIPFCTVTSSRDAHGLVTPILSKYHGQKGDESRCAEIEKPFNTLDTQPRFALVAPTIVRSFGNSDASDINKPVGTVTAGGGGKASLVSAFIAKHFGGTVGVAVDTPLPTTTARGTQNQIVAANLIHLNHGDKQWNGVDEPLRTVTSNNHAALVYSFLIRYFGTSIGQHVTEPLYTITGKDRFGLVMVQFEGEQYVIVDIGMRMLTSRELARAQGFPDTYELTGTKTSQVARIGNSVVPQVAKAVVEANYKGAFCER